MEKILLDFSGAPSAEWTPAVLYFSDADRRKLQGASHMRILIISGGAPFSGRVLAARPVLYGSSWRPVTVSAGGGIETAPDADGGAAEGSVSLRETTDPALGSKYPGIIDRLHPQSARQQVLELQWNDMASGGVAAGADGRAPAIPLESYRVLSFFVKGPRASAPADQEELNKTTLRLIIARGPGSLDRAAETALDLRAPVSVLRPGEWSRVEVRYGGAEIRVSVNGWEGAGDSYARYRPGALRRSDTEQGDQSSYIAAFIIPDGAATLRGGSFSIDEIVLEEPAASYRANAGGSLEWSAPGILSGIGEATMDIIKLKILGIT